MIRPVLLLILLATEGILCAGLARAQQAAPAGTTSSSSSRDHSRVTKLPNIDPDEGSVTGNTYRSRYFRFWYTFPEGLDVDENFMQGEEDESKQAFVLLAAYGGASADGRKGVVISADRNIDPNTRTATDYLVKMMRENYQPNGFEVVSGPRELSLASRPFCRIDYRKEGIYQSAVATLARGYVLTFTLAAPTQAEVEQLFGTLNTLDFTVAPSRGARSAQSGKITGNP